MSEGKQDKRDKNDEKWKSETLREERKARLARMKAKDGGKKPVRTTNPALRLVIALVLVVAILVTGVWFVLNIGVPQQMLTSMTVGSEKIKVVELNYYYHMLASNYGFDLSDATSVKSLEGESGIEGYATLGDFLMDQAAKEVQKYTVLANLATEAGVALDSTDQDTINNFYDELQASADSEELSLGNYLAKNFGKGATKESLRPALERLLLGSKFSDEKTAGFAVSDADIKTYYDENKDEFDILAYRAFTFTADIADDATADQTTAAKAAAKAKADAMLAAVTSEADFKSQCVANAGADDKTAYEEEDASLFDNIRYSDVSSTAQATWLFDETARKTGDKTVIDEGDGSYTVLYFISRAIDDSPRIDVRHILIEADRETATAEAIAAAKTKAESILAEYLAGAKTAESFGDQAKLNSGDSNASEGGLYESVTPGQMVSEFDDWCFAPARQTGDTGIVQTDYGFHVMYFVGQAGIEWQLNIQEVLRDEAYQTFLDAETAKNPYTLNSFGKRFLK